MIKKKILYFCCTFNTPLWHCVQIYQHPEGENGNTDCCQSTKSITKDKYFRISFAFQWEQTSELRDNCLMQNLFGNIGFYKSYNINICIVY